MTDAENAAAGTAADTDVRAPAPTPEAAAAPPVAATATATSGSDKDMIAGLNNRLKQSMTVIKTLKASEAALKAIVNEYQQKEAENAAIYKAKDTQLTHLQVTCDGLKEELRNSEKETEKEETMLTELVTKLELAQSALQKQVHPKGTESSTEAAPLAVFALLSLSAR